MRNKALCYVSLRRNLHRRTSGLKLNGTGGLLVRCTPRSSFKRLWTIFTTKFASRCAVARSDVPAREALGIFGKRAVMRRNRELLIKVVQNNKEGCLIFDQRAAKLKHVCIN